MLLSNPFHDEDVGSELLTGLDFAVVGVKGSSGASGTVV